MSFKITYKNIPRSLLPIELFSDEMQNMMHLEHKHDIAIQLIHSQYIVFTNHWWLILYTGLNIKHSKYNLMYTIK